MKIHKNDNVQIMVGKDRGKQGKVTAVNPEKGTVLVPGLNMFKKHKRPTKQGEKGEIVSLPRPLKAANVMIVCSSCNKPVRIGFRHDGEIKVRFCKKCK